MAREPARTGATDKKINEAGKRAYEMFRLASSHPSAHHEWDEHTDDYRQGWIDDARLRACWLVTADECIVRRGDLRIAIECMRWLANTDIHVPGMEEAEPRLEAAIGEPTAEPV